MDRVSLINGKQVFYLLPLSNITYLQPIHKSRVMSCICLLMSCTVAGSWTDSVQIIREISKVFTAN